MQKQVNPVVAAIVIVALIAVVAFLWFRFSGPAYNRAPGAAGAERRGMSVPVERLPPGMRPAAPPAEEAPAPPGAQ